MLDRALHSPLWQLHVWFDFEHEAAIATWFSSMQLLCVSMVLALFSLGIHVAGERYRSILVGRPLLSPAGPLRGRDDPSARVARLQAVS